MAKGLFSLESSGLKEFVTEMNGFVEHFPEISLKSLAAQEEFVEDKIRTNWVSMAGGSSGGHVYSSIGHSVAYGKQGENSVVGTVGVYKIDSVAASFGITEKDLNAAQIAYWVEFGTSRLRQGGRKKRDAEYSDEQLIQVAAVPFISTAFYSSLDAQQDVFKAEFNRLANSYRYAGA